jgi:hypothetical protein
MEICKQLFDLSKLFENIQNMEVVAASFQYLPEHEIAYRKNENPEVELTPKWFYKTRLILASSWPREIEVMMMKKQNLKNCKKGSLLLVPDS